MPMAYAVQCYVLPIYALSGCFLASVRFPGQRRLVGKEVEEAIEDSPGRIRIQGVTTLANSYIDWLNFCIASVVLKERTGTISYFIAIKLR